MSTKPESKRSGAADRLVRTSRHPLVVLVIGTILGSILIPLINDRAARERKLEDLRAQRALAAIEASNDVDRKLSLLLTTFESFWKDTDEPTQTTRSELRTRIYDLYGQFDLVAWWWFDESWQGARMVGLLDSHDSQEAERLSAAYSASLMESTRAISAVWKASLHAAPPSKEAMGQILHSTRLTLQKTRRKRFELVARLAGLMLRRSWY